MVTSQGSMPPLYTAAAISRSPLLPSSLITATLTLPDACIPNDHVMSVALRCVALRCVASCCVVFLHNVLSAQGKALHCCCHLLVSVAKHPSLITCTLIFPHAYDHSNFV